MSETIQLPVGSRLEFREAILADLLTRAKERASTVEYGPLEGVTVVGVGVLEELAATIASERLPAVSQTRAEVRTPAKVMVAAVCPRCDIPGGILVTIDSELRTTTEGSELHVKAKSKPRTHVCGQLELPERPAPAASQTAMFGDEPAPEPVPLLMIGDGRCGEMVTIGEGIDGFCILPIGHEGDHYVDATSGEEPEAEEGEAVDAPAQEPAEQPQRLERCDFPGCTLYAFHSGNHEDESGQELVA